MRSPIIKVLSRCLAGAPCFAGMAQLRSARAAMVFVVQVPLCRANGGKRAELARQWRLKRLRRINVNSLFSMICLSIEKDR